MMTLQDAHDACVTTSHGKRVTIHDIESCDDSALSTGDGEVDRCCDFFSELFRSPNTHVGSLCHLRQGLIESYKLDVRLGDVYPEDLNADLMIIGLLTEVIMRKGIFA